MTGAADAAPAKSDALEDDAAHCWRDAVPGTTVRLRSYGVEACARDVRQGASRVGAAYLRLRWAALLSPRMCVATVGGLTASEGKIHRVDPDFGSTLIDSNRDYQSSCWVNWKIMGQPCGFQVHRGY